MAYFWFIVFMGLMCCGIVQLTSWLVQGLDWLVDTKLKPWLLSPDNKFMRKYERDPYFNREYAAPECTCKKTFFVRRWTQSCRRHFWEKE